MSFFEFYFNKIPDLSDIRLPQKLCSYCASPVSDDHLPCGRCQREGLILDRVWVLYRYHPPLSEWILAAKFGKNRFALNQLCRVIRHTAHHFHEEMNADVIVPMPMSRRRLYQRGFNQCHYLADEVHRELSIPLRKDLVIKKHGEPQSQQNFRDRKSNIRNHFQIMQPLPPRVIIVDDVMTSGATGRELAKTMKKQGAEYVALIVVARALPQYS